VIGSSSLVRARSNSACGALVAARTSWPSWAHRTSSASWRYLTLVREPAPTAITDVEAVWLDRATLRTWMAERPVIAERLPQLLARRLRHTADDLLELICTDLSGRIARQLLLLVRRFGTREGEALRADARAHPD
jgi:hypothetical protein